MSAYNSPYLTAIASSKNPDAVPVIIVVETKEPLVAAGELVFTGEPPDIVEQVISSISIDISSLIP